MSGFEDLAGLLTVRPLSVAVWADDRSSPFSASWSDTVNLLVREIRHLRPREAILEAGFHDGQLRQDGLPKASARAPETPAVVLTLVGTPHGDLRYPCGTFRTWQDNVRAIALALEALRKVDRYGVTKRGEQYAGWKQLQSPDAALRQRGREILAEHGGDRKAALRATHPDVGGSEDDFKALTAALS